MGGENLKILISPASVEEARIAWACGADIIDIKNTQEGSLGASFPWIIKNAIDGVADVRAVFSASLGDLSCKPGTASLAALGAAACGVHYVKAGLFGPKSKTEGMELMCAVARACKDYNPAVRVVAAGYADYRRFGGLDPQTLTAIAAESGSEIVMVDTFIKDGKNLFDAMGEEEIDDFIAQAHRRGLQVALAGSLRREHLPVLVHIGADIIGVRGALCLGHDRDAAIDRVLTKEFIAAADELRRRQGHAQAYAVAVL